MEGSDWFAAIVTRKVAWCFVAYICGYIYICMIYWLINAQFIILFGARLTAFTCLLIVIGMDKKDG